MTPESMSDLQIGDLCRVLDEEGAYAAPGSIVCVAHIGITRKSVWCSLLFGSVYQYSTVYPDTVQLTASELEKIHDP